MFFKRLTFGIFNILVTKWKFFEIIYYIRMGFSFLLDCNYYILQKWQNNKEHNKKWPFVPDHPYKILIIGDSDYEKQMHCLV